MSSVVTTSSSLDLNSNKTPLLAFNEGEIESPETSSWIDLPYEPPVPEGQDWIFSATPCNEKRRTSCCLRMKKVSLAIFGACAFVGQGILGLGTALLSVIPGACVLGQKNIGRCQKCALTCSFGLSALAEDLLRGSCSATGVVHWKSYQELVDPSGEDIRTKMAQLGVQQEGCF